MIKKEFFSKKYFENQFAWREKGDYTKSVKGIII
jgi:hypothetical protein